MAVADCNRNGLLTCSNPELSPLLLYWRVYFQMGTVSMCMLKETAAIFYVCKTFLFSQTVFMCMISFSFPRHSTREIVTICYLFSCSSFDPLLTALFNVCYPNTALNMEKVFSAYVVFSTLFLHCSRSHWGISCTLINACYNFQCLVWNPCGLIIFGTIGILKHMCSEHSSFQFWCLCEFSPLFWLSLLRNVGLKSIWMSTKNCMVVFV